MNELVNSGKFDAMKLEKQRELFKAYFRLYQARAREFLDVVKPGSGAPHAFSAPITKQECQVCCDLLYAYELKAVVPVYAGRSGPNALFAPTKPSWVVMSQDQMEAIKQCGGRVYIWPIDTPPAEYEAFTPKTRGTRFFV